MRRFKFHTEDWLLMGVVLCAGLFLAAVVLVVVDAHGADLPLPKPRPAPEQCVSPEARPSPGQVITPDPACPTGMRWKRPR